VRLCRWNNFITCSTRRDARQSPAPHCDLHPPSASCCPYPDSVTFAPSFQPESNLEPIPRTPPPLYPAGATSGRGTCLRARAYRPRQMCCSCQPPTGCLPSSLYIELDNSVLMVHVMASIAACNAANLLAALRRVRRANRTGSRLTDSRDLQLMVQGHHPIEVLVVKVRFLRTHLLVAAKEPEGDLIDEAITDVCQCGTGSNSRNYQLLTRTGSQRAF
jgi:hypothetical protein